MNFSFYKFVFVLLVIPAFFLGCSNDDDNMNPPDDERTVINQTSYDLQARSDSGVTGTATFKENSDNTLTVELDLQNTPMGGEHPAHIHFNTAAEGGGIALTLGTVDGDTGESSVTFNALDDGTPITYAELINFDGYINVHLSSTQLDVIVAQGDIGQNDLTANSKTYALGSVAVEDIDGTATFYERINGEALAVIELNNTPEGGEHPAHIHNNTAAEGGGIAFTFVPVDGDTGISMTNIAELDNGTSFGYDDVLEFDGYINVHLSATQLETIVAQGDIGQNELTGTSKTYALGSVAVEDIEGTATFYERVNGEALAVIELQNTPEGGEHPGHIHMNTAAEGGDIAFTFTPVDGDTGMSRTNVAELDNGTAFGYDDVLNYDGYINIHLSAEQLSTLVAQGDIGQNELTGNVTSYALSEVDVAGISGTVEFAERVNQTTLATITLVGTPAGGEHPAHIHENDAITGGGIIVSLNAVNGTTGMSKTQIEALNDGTALTYNDILTLNGYVNVHLSAAQLTTLVAQGNIGANVD